MRPWWMAVIVAATFATVVRAEPRRPTVLWIVADDHAPYVCGAYGNKDVAAWAALPAHAEEGI